MSASLTLPTNWIKNHFTIVGYFYTSNERHADKHKLRESALLCKGKSPSR